MQFGAQWETYQEKHPLLQALLGELVKAALTDELLKDNQGSCKQGCKRHVVVGSKVMGDNSNL